MVAGVIVIDCWLSRLCVGELGASGDGGVSVFEEAVE